MPLIGLELMLFINQGDYLRMSLFGADAILVHKQHITIIIITYLDNTICAIYRTGIDAIHKPSRVPVNERFRGWRYYRGASSRSNALSRRRRQLCASGQDHVL